MISAERATLEETAEHRRTEAALRQALAEQQARNEQLARFISTAGHELRTPLTAILATTETLLAYRQRMEPEQIDRRLGKIRDQVNAFKTLIDDILLLARIQSGRGQFNPEPLDLDACCREIIEARQSCADLAVRLQYTCTHAPLPMRLDRDLMRRVLAPLLAFASRNAPVGTTVNVQLDQAADRTVLGVHSAGSGLAEADLQHLFEPFFPGAAQTAPGTGLELAIAREAAALHGGNITLENQPGGGFTIYVQLPCITAEETGHDQDSGD